ncbi:hypothetical protein [Butyrivibrio sp. AE3006]|uniref:hypothetical protein n=1 Tax=Butyrivibrio sp. AE3006 TaxID=1280673 RepID=UPI00041B08BF|nr:hypothetical protein [Butyrivibrio sp. AE3006]
MENINHEGFISKTFNIIISFLSLIILAFFVYISATVTCLVDSNEKTYFMKDNVFIHVIFTGVILAIMVFLGRFSFFQDLLKEKNKKNLSKVKNIMLAIIFLMSALFVYFSRLSPVSDQAFVQLAAYGLRSKNYSFFMEGGYIHTYPNQMGLMLFSYVFFSIFGFGNFLAFQIMNALFLVLFYKRLSDITGFIYEENATPQLMVLLFGILFYPLHIYCTFVYGTIPGLALSVSAIYHALKFEKDKFIKNCILSALSILAAMLLKSNYLIFFIAIFIYIVMAAIRNKKAILLALPALFVVAFLIQAKVPSLIVRQMTGIDVGKGASTYSWIAMGLQDSDLAEGWYNGFNTDSYEQSGYNPDINKKMATDAIKERLEYFSENPYDCLEFFSRKLSSEWNDPSYEALWIIRPLQEIRYENNPVRKLLTYNNYFLQIGFLNWLQFFILLGCLLFLVFKNKNTGNCFEILAITIIGGFLFHIMWEAKSQYTLPYFVLMLPMAAIGYHKLLFDSKELFKKNRLRIFLRLVLPLLFFYLIYSGTIGKNLTSDNASYTEAMQRELEADIR